MVARVLALFEPRTPGGESRDTPDATGTGAAPDLEAATTNGDASDPPATSAATNATCVPTLEPPTVAPDDEQDQDDLVEAASTPKTSPRNDEGHAWLEEADTSNPYPPGSEGYDWFDAAPALADWAMTHLVVRTDAYGLYTSQGASFTKHDLLDRAVLLRHFQGLITCATHTTSTENRCLGLTLDVDAHDQKADPERNFQCALRGAEMLREYKLNPLVIASNGKGGFHVRVIFKKLIASEIAHWLGTEIKRRLEEDGFPALEHFPKQANLGDSTRYGNFIRVFGKHHKSGFWSQVWSFEQERWLKGKAAIAAILRTAGDETKALKTAYESRPKAQAEAQALAQDQNEKTAASRAQSRDRKPRRTSTREDPDISEETLRSALEALPPVYAENYNKWLKDVLMGIHSWDSGERGRQVAHWFSQKCPEKYDPEVLDRKWGTFNQSGGITVRTILRSARENGWTRPGRDATNESKGTPTPLAPANDRVGPTAGQEPRAAEAQRNSADVLDDLAPETESGNAETLVAWYGHQFLHVSTLNKFLHWDECRWKLDFNRNHVARLALTTVRRRTLPDKFAKESERARSLNAMLEIASHHQDITLEHGELDRDPWLLNVPNGTIDLRTGQIRPHDRSDLITQLCPTPYNPDSPCPLWEGALKLIFNDDSKLIAYVQRLCGYFMTGSTQEQIFTIFYGSGENGKSTILNCLMDMLGPDYAMKAPRNFMLVRRGEVHPTELTDLCGKRLVTAIESGQGQRLDEPLIKEATGSDPIRARRMREDFWEFKPTHKVGLCTNHKPRIEGTDHAIWRRVMLIPFTVQIPSEQKDTRFPDRLTAERPGILAWCVRGCLEWLKLGSLKPPDRVLASTTEYRAEEDVLGQFLREECVVHVPADRDSPYQVTAGALYKRYDAWCKARGEEPLTQREFGRRMTALGACRFERDVTMYAGIGLRPDSTDSQSR